MLTGETFTPQKFLAAGICASALFTFIIIESKRLKMKRMWIVYLSTFLIAIAFAAPLFLLMRELKLRENS